MRLHAVCTLTLKKKKRFRDELQKYKRERKKDLYESYKKVRNNYSVNKYYSQYLS